MAHRSKGLDSCLEHLQFRQHDHTLPQPVPLDSCQWIERVLVADLDTLQSHSRILWEDNKGEIPIKGDLIPFVITGNEIRLCQDGPKRNRKQFKHDTDHDYAEPSDGVVNNHDKMHCPMKIQLRSVICFPEYKMETDTPWNRRNNALKLKSTFNEEVVQQYKVYVKVIGEHKNHKTRHKFNRLGKFQCSTCPLKLSTKAGLVKHEFCHTGEKPHVCCTCGASFAIREYLMNHVKGHSTQRDFACDICGKTFARKTTLNAHLETHAVERNYHCEKCEKSFTTKMSLDNHQKVHYDEKDYICHVCGKAFGCARYLKQHLTWHLGVKKFKCEQCGNEYYNRTIYEEHLRRHAGLKLVKCELCPQSFYNQRCLKNHMKFHTHSQETGSSKCNTCQMFFKSARSLQCHMSKKHLEPAGCKFCNKTFVNKKQLKKHIYSQHKVVGAIPAKLPKNLQAGFKKALCDICGKVLSNKYRLKNHLSAKHDLSRDQIARKIAELSQRSTNDIRHMVQSEKQTRSNAEIGGPVIKLDGNIKVYEDSEENENLAVLRSRQDCQSKTLNGSVEHGDEQMDTSEVLNGETEDEELQSHIVIVINDKEDEYGSSLNSSIYNKIVELGNNQSLNHDGSQEIGYTCFTENGDEIIVSAERERRVISMSSNKTEPDTSEKWNRNNTLSVAYDEHRSTGNEKYCDINLPSSVYSDSKQISLDKNFPKADSTEEFLKFENALRNRIDSLSEYGEYEDFLDRTIKTLQYAKYKHRQKSLTRCVTPFFVEKS